MTASMTGSYARGVGVAAGTEHRGFILAGVRVPLLEM